MKDVSVKKLLVRQEKQLNVWLGSSTHIDSIPNLMRLKGYLFGVCTTPAMLMPSFWLPPIFGGELLDFNEAQTIENIEFIMQLYNYTAQQVVAGKYKLPFKECFDSETASNNFQAGHPLHEWSFGVDLALQSTMHYWDDVPLNEDDEDFVNNCWISLTFFADEHHVKKEFKSKLKKNNEFNEIVQIFYNNLPDVISAYACESRDLYLESLEEDGDADDADFDGWQQEKFDRKNASLSPSEELLEQASVASSRSEATHFAKQALKLDPNNIEIYLFLGQHCAANAKERIDWLVQAVKAGENSLGEVFFKQNAGHFWGLHETRPYMQALFYLADFYREAGQLSQAISCYEKCLSLNPNDNQGVRTVLVGVYIAQHKFQQAEALMKAYGDDESAFMRYSRVLISYITEGDAPVSRELKADAKSYNKHVPHYLSGKHKMPKDLPEFYGLGDKDEAIIYTHGHREVWRKTMGAVGWLNK